MAKLKNIEVFSFDTANPRHGAMVTVGNNRAVMTDCELRDGAEVRRVKCFLHGHCVATFTQTWYSSMRHSGVDVDPVAMFVKLDTHGWNTTTTRAAINDFLAAMRAEASVSMKGGKLGAEWRNLAAETCRDVHERTLGFWCARRAAR